MSERAALANHPEDWSHWLGSGKLKRRKKALRSSYELLSQRNMELQSSWDCKQAHGTACKLMKLQASSWNCMQAHGTVCKLMELHASSWNCMQAHETTCKLIEMLMQLQASP